MRSMPEWRPAPKHNKSPFTLHGLKLHGKIAHRQPNGPRGLAAVQAAQHLCPTRPPHTLYAQFAVAARQGEVIVGVCDDYGNNGWGFSATSRAIVHVDASGHHSALTQPLTAAPLLAGNAEEGAAAEAEPADGLFLLECFVEHGRLAFSVNALPAVATPSVELPPSVRPWAMLEASGDSVALEEVRVDGYLER